MKNSISNIQIIAKAAELANGNNGYTVSVQGLDDKVSCTMKFSSPLKTMRYMFLLSKRLSLRINSIDLAAVHLDYMKAKATMESTAAEVQTAANETKEEAESSGDDKPEPLDELATPNEQEYDKLKKKHPDAILLFRCGDFYEAYKDDAQDVADILKITLTHRLDGKSAMTGFPHHSLDIYLPKLNRAGRRVAIVDSKNTKVVAK